MDSYILYAIQVKIHAVLKAFFANTSLQQQT